MAKMKFDALMQTVQGKLGNYVFRRMRGKMIIAPSPTVSSSPPTEGQERIRTAFSQAAAYANAVLSDPTRRAGYERIAEQRDQLVRAVVMGDFLNPPDVTEIDLHGYRGQVGDVIKVLADDDVEVVSVSVKIIDAATAALVEEGVATKEHGVWNYVATVALAADQAVTVEATALDRPGHPGVATKAFP
jgi:hypothetical protein